jgi:hypothetical protein
VAFLKYAKIEVASIKLTQTKTGEADQIYSKIYGKSKNLIQNKIQELCVCPYVTTKTCHSDLFLSTRKYM